MAASKAIELSNGKSSLKIEGNKISLHANKIEIAGRNGEPASKIAIKALNTLLYGKDSIKIHSDKQVIISSKGLTRVIAKTDLTISGEHTTIRSKAMTNIVGNPINLISTGPQAAPKANAAAPVTTFKIDAKPELASSVMHPQAQTGAIQRTIRDAPTEQRGGRPENMVLFVNGYRFGGVSEEPNSDDGVSETDRHHYWEGLDTQFYRRLNSGTVFYADGHHSIGTSNHRDMLSFYNSARSCIDTFPKNLKELAIKHGQDLSKFWLSPVLSYLIEREISDPNYIDGKLNKTSNVYGFNLKRRNGQRAAQKLLSAIKKIHASKHQAIDKLDIVAHSMGYAYALGMKARCH